MGLVLPAAPAPGPTMPRTSFASVVHYELKLATRANLSVSLAPAQPPQHTGLGASGGQAQGTGPPPPGSSASKVWEVGQGCLRSLTPLS